MNDIYQKKIFIIFIIFLAAHYAYFFFYRHFNYKKLDFSVFYGVSYAIRHGIHPFDNDGIMRTVNASLESEVSENLSNFIQPGSDHHYLPFIFWLYIPLTFIPFKIAKSLHLIFQHLIFFSGLYFFITLLLRENGKKLSLLFTGFLFLLIAHFTPLIYEFALGNINIFIFSGIIFSIFLYIRKLPVCSGILLALLTVIKIFPAILFLEYLRTKNFQAAVSFLTGVAVLLLCSIFIYEPGILKHWFLNSIMNSFVSGISLSTNQSIEGALVRIFTENSTTVPIIAMPPFLIKAVVNFLRLAAAGYIVYLMKTLNARNSEHSIFFIVICLALAIPLLPIAWINYGIIYLMPLIYILYVLANNDYPVIYYIFAGCGLTLLIVDVDYRDAKHAHGIRQLVMNLMTYGYIIFCVLLIKIWKRQSQIGQI